MGSIVGDDDDDEINGEEEWRYLIIRPEKAGVGDILRFWRKGDVESGSKFIESNCCDNNDQKDYYGPSDRGSLFDGKDNRWVIVVSVIARKLIMLFKKPLEWFGWVVDFLLNLIGLNGNLFGLIRNFLKGKVVIPKRGTSTFISTIGHLDGRIDLDKTDNFGGESSSNGIEIENNKSFMDLCIMASKLAYENANVVKDVVVSHWKMHLVGFYNGWNDYQQEMSTQVFVLCDKPKDANFILISFRGTEPYDADDWSTDFDYSWYEIPQIGKFHMGFMEALGLGNRTDTPTFRHNILETKNIKVSPGPDMANLSAYNTVRTKLKELLKEHRNAKFIVTGHSLGGALAILFPTMLTIHEESEMMERLLGVCTFGQPRIGDEKLGRFMEDKLNKTKPRYFRVVYCNDMVPRVPFDDKTFLYKHFGICLYYNSFYYQQIMEEEPNKNFYGIRYLIEAHMNAVWELIRGFLMGYMHGKDYKEDFYSMLARLVGLMLPGIAAHGPRDYVNSMRLGRQRAVQIQMTSLD